MPPRTARSPKKDSVTAAAKKHLSKPVTTTTATAAGNGKSAKPATASRVSRRRADVVPQKAPEWQKMALKTAAASAKLIKRAAKKEPAPAAKATGRRASTAPKAKNGKRGKATKEEEDDDEDAREAAAAGSDSSVSAEESSSSNSDEGDAGSGGAKKRNAKASKSTGTAAAAARGKRGSRVLVADLMCSRCKLRMDHWPFCGITGEAHAVPVPAAAGGEADTKDAAAA